MQTTHTIEAEFAVQFHLSGAPDGEREVAYPTALVTYKYTPGSPAYTPRGEYAPIDPPEPAECDFISATLIDRDGIDPTMDQLRGWAETWLDDDGYDLACRHADEDRWSAT